MDRRLAHPGTFILENIQAALSQCDEADRCEEQSLRLVDNIHVSISAAPSSQVSVTAISGDKEGENRCLERFLRAREACRRMKLQLDTIDHL